MSEKNKLDAIVKLNKIIFKNGTFHILSVTNTKTLDVYVVKGDILEINYGQDYRLIADYITDKKYGGQYNIALLTPHNELKNRDDFKKFLMYYVAPSIIDSIFDTLEQPIEAIKNGDIEELCKAKGVQEYTANRIIGKYKENETYYDAYIQLGEYGLSVAMIKRVLLKYKNVSTALSRLKTNPYELVSIPNIGWVTADEIAQKMGFGKMSKERLTAFIKHHLKEQAQLGNSWLTPKQLTNEIFVMYSKSGISVIDKKQEVMGIIKEVYQEMHDSKVLHWNPEKTFICLSKYYNLELKVANELKRLLNAKSNVGCVDLDVVVKEIEAEKGYSLTDEQVNAIKLAVENNVVLITGSAGVGKTSSVYGLLKTMPNKNVAQVALSGKASSNLTDVTKMQGSTIHRLLKYQPEGGFFYNKENPLPYDIIILDELSMLSGELFLSLIEAIPNGSKLIMLGDNNQLSPIGTMNILNDILDNTIIPKQVLTKIHRQAQRSAIITESFKVKDGKQITSKNFSGTEIRGELQDLVLDIYDDKKYTLNKIIKHFEKEHERLQDINKIQIIVPMREKGDCSAFNINNRIQDIYNPLNTGMRFLKLKRYGKDLEFRVGDKVINRKNTYGIYDTKFVKKDIFNGYMGIITDIDMKNKSITINFNNEDVGEIVISGDNLQNIELAYSITVHSFQGSQCDTVIVGMDYSSYKLLSKELAYTSMTRSQKKLIICAENQALRHAISTSDVSTKQTFLSSMLEMNDLELVELTNDDENDNGFELSSGQNLDDDLPF